MKEKKQFSLFLLTAGMELSWINAWAHYLWLSFLHRSSPFIEIVFTFIVAWGFTRFSTDRGWKVITILGLHLLGFFLAGLRMIHVFGYAHHSFLSKDWMIEFLTTSRTAGEWITLLFVLFWPLFLWIRGIHLARTSLTYLNLTSRFDLGLSAFFVLFLIKLLLWVKGGIKIEEHVSLSMLFSFFIFGLLEISLSRNQCEEKKDFLPQFHNIGMVLSFVLVVMSLGTGMVLFFRPYLNMAAEITYSGLKIIARPLGSILLTILQFMFAKGINRPAEITTQEKGGVQNPSLQTYEQDGWIEFFGKVLSWGLLGILALVAAIAFGVTVFYLCRYLFSKTPASQTKRDLWGFYLREIDKLKTFILNLWSRIPFRRKKQKDATQIFITLLRWGHRSGFHYVVNETPLEYSFRLKKRFPILKKELTLITEAFHQEVFGNRLLSEDQRSDLSRAFKRLRSPKHWPSRFKHWLIGPNE